MITRALGKPDSRKVVARARWLLLGAWFITVLTILPSLILNAIREPAAVMGLVALAWLVGALVATHVRGTSNWAVEVANAIAGGFVISGLGSANHISSIVFPTLLFLSLYGSASVVYARLALWLSMWTVVALRFGETNFDGLVIQMVRLVVIVLIVRVLANNLVRQERIIAREAALTAAGVSLVSATTEKEVGRVAIDATFRLAADLDSLHVGVLERYGDELVLTEAIGSRTDIVGARFPVSTVPAGMSTFRPNERIGGFRDVVVSPLVVSGRLFGAVALAAGETIDVDVTESLDALAVQLVLSLERIDHDQRFRSLVQHSTDVITIIASDRSIQYHSPSVRRLVGVEPADMIGRAIDDVVHPDDLRNFIWALENAESQTQTTVNVRWKHQDGQWRYTETTVTDMRHDSAIDGWVLNTRDVTERTALEVELRQSQKLESIGRLAAGIAHEINTPIQFVGDNLSFLSSSFDALIGLTGVYKEALDEPVEQIDDDRRQTIEVAEEQAGVDFLREEVPVAVDQALEGVRRVASIVTAMKALGHPSYAEQRSANLNEAISNTVVVARNEYKYVADVATDFGELPPVMCFESDLNQVFLNLLVNAAHAISTVVERDGGRGTITISTRTDGDDAVISIADTGTGIPKDIKDRIFDPFFTTKEVGKGTGQGLALARTVVNDRHGGTISVESEVGTGTTFTIRVPIAGSQSPAGALT